MINLNLKLILKIKKKTPNVLNLKLKLILKIKKNPLIFLKINFFKVI
jgi:hypothetical protein